VRTFHAGVHGELEDDGCFLTGLDGRRTDDREGRSAALHDFDLGLALKKQGLVADVFDPKDGLDRLVHLDVTVVKGLLGDGEARAGDGLRRLAGLGRLRQWGWRGGLGGRRRLGRRTAAQQDDGGDGQRQDAGSDEGHEKPTGGAARRGWWG